MRTRSRLPLTTTLAVALVSTLAVASTAPAAAKKTSPAASHVTYVDWSNAADFASGTSEGTALSGDDLIIGTTQGTIEYTDPFGNGTAKRYEYATWTSPEVRPGFNLTELVASWNAATPVGTWLQVDVRGTPDTGGMSKWYILGRWTHEDSDLHRTSVPAQGDDLAYVAIDTLVTTADRSMSTWQLRVTLYRTGGTTATPRLSLVGAMASALPSDTKDLPASPSGGAEGIVLDVPTYSQEIHIGEYPQWDGGGEAWCSPTSTAMVLSYWGAGPTPEEYSWVDPAYEDPWVDHAARYVYDYNYDGAGNWPFNTAYAGHYGLEAFVTRLRSLTEAEQFIKAGIPLVVSVSFKKGELTGAGYGTNGHLLVIVGFAENGDVVVNDPASHLIQDNNQVRTTYDRTEFENVWVPHSGGITYVIHPADVPLPPAPAQPNW